ncbi:methylmalonyl-CoA mutase subunit beta [Robiginitalea sp. IMCC43444]|uniref:methylmalonyl-CoA mutase subunit beta n=1 Tax=Robiginitalea sp. IMCC43444 TaxID=3459121 RepID=UPI0040410EC8
MKTNELLKDFEPVSAKQWKQKLQADLKGADYNELLSWTSPEGIQVKPFYSEEDLPEEAGIPATGSGNWKIGYRIGNETPSEQVSEALQADIQHFLVQSPESFSATFPHKAVLSELQQPVYLDFSGTDELLPDWISQSNLRHPVILVDPIGHLAATGNWYSRETNDAGSLLKVLSHPAASSAEFRFAVHADLYQNAGANRVQELAYALSHALEYLLWSAEEKSLQPLLQQPVFHLAAGGDYFFEIAKFRALRKLWARVAPEYGFIGDCLIFASPSLRNKTIYDYNTNMLRTTTECMAAILGGADLICNLPYDQIYQYPNTFADRIARNQLQLLRHESYFSQVHNPADGTYYIESLTDQLGSKALELLKQLEKGGGFLKQLRAHTIQQKIRESATKEQQAFDSGSKILVGSNKYPNADNKMQVLLQKPIRLAKKSRKTLLEPIIPSRLATNYEQKRLQDEPR